MVRKLKRIAPLKFGIVVGAVYGVISLILIPFFILAMLISMFAPSENSGMTQGVGAVVAIVFCVLAPVLYAVFGFIFGALAALIYNLVAGWTGGIEFEVE